MPDLLMTERGAFVRGAVRRVLTPAIPPPHLFVRDFPNEDKYLFADAGAFRCLALAANVAACRPDHLVYLPAGGSRPADALRDEKMASLSIVFGHPHSGFRPSDWKALRRRLGPAVPVRERADFGKEEPRPWWRYGVDDPNVVDVCIHAATLFITAPPAAFRVVAHVFDDAMRGAHRDYHSLEYGITLRDGYRRRHRGRSMEIECVTWTHWT